MVKRVNSVARSVVASALAACMVLSAVPAPALAEAREELAAEQTPGDQAEAAAEEADEPAAPEPAAAPEPEGSPSLSAMSSEPVATGVLPTRGYQDPTCSWSLDGEGNLTIYPTDGVSGTFFMWAEEPFKDYKDQITSVSFAEGTHTTSMIRLFEKLKSLKTADLSKLDTSECTSMEAVFMDCHSLESVNLQGLQTSKVTDMGGLFARCYALESVDLSSLDTSSVTSMYCMFADCRSLTELDVSNFNTSKVEDMCVMFSGCTGLVSLDVSNFNTSNVQRFAAMFEDCDSLQSVNISGMDMSSAGTGILGSGNSTGGMFGGCDNLREVISDGDADLLNTVLENKVDDVTVVNPASVDPTKTRIAIARVSGIDDWVYDGAEHDVVPTLTYDGQNLVANRDYTLSGDVSAKDPGEYELTIEGAGSFEGTMSWPYTVSKRPVTVIADNKTKVAGEYDPPLTATVRNAVEGEMPNYYMNRADGEAAGDYTITVDEYYEDPANRNYDITWVPGILTILPSQGKASISDGVIDGLEGWTYDGTTHAQSPTLTLDGAQLVEGTDFEFEGELSARDAKYYTIIARGKGDYEGTVVSGYSVARKDAKVKADDKSKTAGEADPELTATVTGVIEGDELQYSLSRTEGDDVGDYEITAAGQTFQGNYRVSFEPGTFTILEGAAQPRVHVDELDVAPVADQTHTGQEITPEPLVSYGGTALVLGRDYSLSYASNKEIGTATITLEGVGGYEGTRTLTFNIVAAAQDPAAQDSVLNELRADYANARASANSAASAVATREAEVAQAQAAYDELLSQDDQAERAQAVQDALAELNAAQESLSHAQAAYNDATAAIQQNENQIAELENGMPALNNAVGTAQQGVTSAQQGVATAQQERDTAAADVATKQQAYDDALDSAQAEVAKGSVGFFQRVGALSAASLLTDQTSMETKTNTTFASHTTIGGAVDATNLTNMFAALDWIEYCNDNYRTPYGASALLVTDNLMASAQRNANFSTFHWGHASNMGYGNGENLCVSLGGKVNGYRQWYDQEKVIYDRAVQQDPSIAQMTPYELMLQNYELYRNVGHYLNIADPDFKTTGLGINSTSRSNAGNTYGGAAIQQFGYSTTGAYTVAAYRTRLLNYYNSIAGDSVGATELAALQSAQQMLANKEAALTQANDVLSTAQANLQSAQQAVTDAQAQKTALENKRSGLAQAQTNAAAARDNAQATVSQKQQAYDAAVAALNDTTYATRLAQAQTALEQAQQNLSDANSGKQTADAACAAALAALNDATNIAHAQVTGIEDREYTWDEAQQNEPRLLITVTKGSRSETYELVRGTDYTASSPQREGAGAKVVFTGTSDKDSGSFWGTTSGTYDLGITDLGDATIGDVQGWTYDGRSHTVVPSVTCEGVKLNLGTDFTVSNNTATDVGEYELAITGIGGYTGERKAPFRVSPADVSGATIASIRGRGYDGKPYEPKPKVTLGGKVLVEGTDFDFSYKNNVSASNGNPATLTVTGKGNYKGTATASFEVWKNGQPMTAWAVARQAPAASLATRDVVVESPIHVAHAVSAAKPMEYRKTGGDSRLNVDLHTGRVTVRKGTPAGTHKVTIRAIAFGGSNYADGSRTVECQVRVVSGAKLDQSMVVTATDVTRTSLSLASADYVTRPFSAAMAAGNVTYRKASGSARLSVDSSGRLRVLRGTAPGTYAATVSATAAGDAGYRPCTRTVTVKVIVR